MNCVTRQNFNIPGSVSRRSGCEVQTLSFSRVSTTVETVAFLSDFEAALRVDRFLDLEVGMFP